jgi:cold shock CspA family protein
VGDGYRSSTENDKVEFTEIHGEKGSQASEIKVIQ